MDPIDIVSHISKHPDGNLTRTALHAFTHDPLDEPCPRETVRRVLQDLCKDFDWKIGSVFCLDEQSTTLRHIESWYGSFAVMARFGIVSEWQTFARGNGFYGRIWRSGQVAWIANVCEDTSYLRSKAASVAGLHTAVRFPLRDANRVVGVLELYSDRIREVDQHLLETMGNLAREIASVIERVQSVSQLDEYPDEFLEPRQVHNPETNHHARSRHMFQAMNHRMNEARKSKRRHLVAELHDQISQSLTVLNLAQGRLSTESTVDMASRLEKCIVLVEEITGNIRNLTLELHPAVLKNDRLIAALRWSAERFQKRSGVVTTVVGEEPTPRLPAMIEIALFRAVQECLFNLVRHAYAGTATIILEIVGRLARLTVMDDGIGFDACMIPHLGQAQGWSTQIMPERLTAVGGRLYLDSAIGHGTRIVAEAAH